ncbi:hypothetical protein [Salinarimonas ramus]|uniref:Uncharacterized protein n=1 Tax=Salinarimonas ramus TaxID=690164 RepID=A0A917Q5S7_9HYPH|nr:hypothetical protein [Salinarimonas ramus]GGK26968.1 hypothetical protein GCM10011322_11810 [Salinarimonas ramus]
MTKATKKVTGRAAKRMRGMRGGRMTSSHVSSVPPRPKLRKKPDAPRSPALAGALARLDAAPDDFLSWVGTGQPWPGEGPEVLGDDERG